MLHSDLCCSEFSCVLHLGVALVEATGSPCAVLKCVCLSFCVRWCNAQFAKSPFAIDCLFWGSLGVVGVAAIFCS